MWLAWLKDREQSQATAQKYLDALVIAGMAPNTVALRAYAIKRWFKFNGKTAELDCPTIRMNEPEYLTTDEVYKVLDSCRTLLEGVLVTVLFDTAVRVSELLNLELDDIDYEHKLITVTRKGGRREVVNISQSALTMLDEWIETRHSDDERVFMDINYQYVRLVLKELGKRVGIDLRAHLLRHSRAIQMLMAGTDIHVVSQHLGHTSIATTMNIYGRFKAVHLKELVPAW